MLAELLEGELPDFQRAIEARKIAEI